MKELLKNVKKSMAELQNEGVLAFEPAAKQANEDDLELTGGNSSQRGSARSSPLRLRQMSFGVAQLGQSPIPFSRAHMAASPDDLNNKLNQVIKLNSK
jgi:hypothetical protein